ncbi:O-antigen ligase family protein [Bordetella avium]|uniref:O-antigen ligase family protein n=1 Tax=Bordetella avium TaxID=521 RepID=UPI000AA12657|nr:O-antigen ligase family protein [Bordetella avium]WQE34385.1 O-antigen ligase family protein [Bordetella avium]SUV67987.1 capsular polysaccharide biosynthesis protein [Bordetella avium]
MSTAAPFEPSRSDRRAVWLLVGLSLVFAIVPDNFSLGTVGIDANHTIMQGSGLRQIQYGSLFLWAAFLAWRHLSVTLSTLRAANPFLLLVVAYCLMTALWSPYPDITIKRSIIMIGLVLIGVAVAPPVGAPRQFLRAVMISYTAIMVVSFFVALLAPSVGVDTQLGNAWRGITWQKNMLGSISGFAAMLWLREFLIRPRKSVAAALLFSLFMLVMAKSATAILVTGLGTGVYLLTRHRLMGGRHAGVMVLLSALLGCLYALLFFYVAAGRMPNVSDVVGPVTALFNKSSDLTGRGIIWDLVEVAIDQHRVWGIGYSAFWVGEGGPAQYIANRIGWMPGHAHNGFLDILVDMGEVGMGLFLACLVWHAGSLMRLFRIDREDAAMHLGICVTILISNFSESQILRDTSFQNIMFIYSSLAISGRLVQARRARLS